MRANIEPERTQSGLVPPVLLGLCCPKMRWIFSGDVSDEAKRNIRTAGDRVGEVGSRDSGKPLGRSPRKSAPNRSIALKARFNPAEETPYG
jgi:hypothetical protein